MSTLVVGDAPQEVSIRRLIPQAELIANTTQQFVAPMDGYWDGMDTCVNAAVTTGGTLTPKNNSQAVYATDTTQGGAVGYTETIVGVAPGTPAAVAGLVQTIANAAAAGVIQSTQATPGDPSLLVKKGQLIQVVPAGFATAGELEVVLRFRSESLSVLNPLVM